MASEENPRLFLTDEAVLDLRAREFPAAKNATHLKASGGSPMCRSAFDAQERYLRQMCFEGDLHYTEYLKDIECARERIAAYIGASPSEIGFTVNSSSAASIAANMLERAGVSRVYYPVSEFPTSVHALAHSKAELVAVGDPYLRDKAKDRLDAVRCHLDKNPPRGRCALIASHVSYLNGATLDLCEAAKFCKAHGLLFVLNATQSFGALAMDVEGADMLFATGLKWAFAGYGAGFLYIRQSLIDSVGLPNRTGWLSVSEPYKMDNRDIAPIQAARSLDTGGGMPHFGPLLGLNGALGMYEAIGNGDIRLGVSAVEARLTASAAYLGQNLENAGFDLLGPKGAPQKSGIVSLVAADAKERAEKLRKADILVSVRALPAPASLSVIRFGVHFFNTKKELNSALSVLV